MWIPRRTVKLVLTLCLLVFQVQVLAAGLLGCRHVQGVGSIAVQAGCPFHRAEAGTQGAGGHDRMLDCTKCALHCAIGAVAPFAVDLASTVVLTPDRPFSAPGRHFYRFTPEADFRPPISRLL
jgi:hypothetical protein